MVAVSNQSPQLVQQGQGASQLHLARIDPHRDLHRCRPGQHLVAGLIAHAVLDLQAIGVFNELRADLIGVNALHGDALSDGHAPYEVRVRVAGRTETMSEAARIGEEVETLYTNGPAGGGGAWKSAREVIAVASTLIPEAHVATSVQIFEA